MQGRIECVRIRIVYAYHVAPCSAVIPANQVSKTRHPNNPARMCGAKGCTHCLQASKRRYARSAINP